MDKKTVEQIIKKADLVPSFSHVETTDKLSAELTFRLPSATKRLIRDLWEGADAPFRGVFKNDSEIYRYIMTTTGRVLARVAPDSLRNPALADYIKQEEIAKNAAKTHMTARMLETTNELVGHLLEAIKHKDWESGGGQLDTHIVLVNDLGITWREAYLKDLTGRPEWNMIKEGLGEYSEYLGLLEE